VTDRVDEGAIPRHFLVLVGAITIGGLLLRLPSFNDSVMGDEISTYFIVVGHNLSQVLLLVHSNQETSPPLFFVLAWATKGILGNPVQSIRLVSLATGTAAIPLTFLLGLMTVGRRAGLVGATCVALSPYMIFYSSEARPYMLLLFLALLSTVALLRAVDTGRNKWWVAYAACSCAAAYTHYTVAFFLIVQLAWALWTQPRVRRALVVANLAVAVAYVPWLGGLREDLRAPSFIAQLAPLNFPTLKYIEESFWVGNPLVALSKIPGTVMFDVAIIGLAVAVVGLGFRALGSGRVTLRLPNRTVLIVLLAVAPAILLVLYSWTRVDVLGGTSQIASWPGLALAIGALVVSPPKPWRQVAVVLTLGAYAVGGVIMLTPAAQRTDDNAAVAYIAQVGSNGDPIVSAPFFANPYSELDISLAVAGQSQHHPVIRLGTPPLAEQLAHLSGPHPKPVFYGLPVASPQAVANQAVALAQNGTIFLVSSIGPTPAVLHFYPNSEVSLFYKALPARFRFVGYMTFPGAVHTFPVAVSIFKDGRAAARP
jgi:4-amino-4-deoxy-L-arabinose transferase-like glycosyltransferase